MVDFNKGEERLNKYLGSEKKTTVYYNNELYMVKYPDPVRSKSNKLSYMNNQYSEHIGCNIFRSCGIPAQETVLGHFTDHKGKDKTVVGCKDFTQDGGILYELSKLSNQTPTSDGDPQLSIESVYGIINESKLLKDKEAIISGFWDIFVVDALIGNSDRHFGNWGLLEKGGELTIAPVYACGSSLSALYDDSYMGQLLDNTAL